MLDFIIVIRSQVLEEMMTTKHYCEVFGMTGLFLGI